MSKRRAALPADIVTHLNAMGLGGRSVYVPLLRTTRSPAEQVTEKMIAALKAGRAIHLDDYPNLVSLRTLQRCRERACQAVLLVRKKHHVKARSAG